MTTEALSVIGGVNTHKHTHHAAAVNQHGRLLGSQEFPATDPATNGCWAACANTVRSGRSKWKAPARSVPP